MDTTRSSGHDQVEDPTKIHHPEEEEHHESGASKMYKRVKARAKKFKNSLTKHGNEPDHDVEEEEDDETEDQLDQDLQKHAAPVHESSAVKGGVTGQPESLSHPRETNVPATEEITPPGTHVPPVVSSDYSKLDEPETLRDATYGHEALSHSVRSSEETRDAPPVYPGKSSDLSEREESRETHQVPLKTTTPVSLLSSTEDDETSRFAPPGEYLGRQPEVNTETESGASDYQSKVTNPTHQGGGEAGVPEITESVGRMKVMEESFDQKSESEIRKDSPVGFGGESGAELGKDFPVRSFEFDQKTESGIDKDSPAGFGGESGAESREDFPAKSHEFEQTIGSEIGKDTEAEKPGTERREDFLGKNYEFEQEMESAVGKDSPTRFRGESETGLGEGLSLKNDSIGKDPTKIGHGYGEESESGLEKEIPVKSDDVKVETGLGRDLPTGTNDEFSPEFSGPKDRDDVFDSEADQQTRYETQDPKPSTYTEMIGSAISSSLGYSGEKTAGHESPVGVKNPGTDAEKSTLEDEKVKETGSPLPLSGGGSGTEETEKREEKYSPARDYLPEKEKLTPEEEDKAFSKMVAEKLNLGGEEKKTTEEGKVAEVKTEKIPSDEVSEEKEHGEAVEAEAGSGGGMVGKIKASYNYWLGGTPEEVKPKSPLSVKDSSQSLGSTVGTKGFPDSGESGLGETGGSTGALPVQKGL